MFAVYQEAPGYTVRHGMYKLIIMYPYHRLSCIVRILLHKLTFEKPVRNMDEYKQKAIVRWNIGMAENG